MTIDADLLRWARLEDLERLARSLRIVVDRSGSKERRHMRLVKQIATRIDAEKRAEQGNSGYGEVKR